MYELNQIEELRRILGKVEIETIIKRINNEPLKQTERNYLSRSIRPKLIAARILSEQKILEKIRRTTKSNENTILYNLSRYGYDLITINSIKKQKTIKIEDLICEILLRNPEPRYIEAIPIILLINKIDTYKLLEIAINNNFRNKLGYLIETAIIIAKKKAIKHNFGDLYEYLKKDLDKTKQFLTREKDETYTKFLEETSPKRIQKWNLLGRFFDEDFTSIASVYL